MKRLLIASLRICSWSDMSGMVHMHQVFPLVCWTMGESGIGSMELSKGIHRELLDCVNPLAYLASHVAFNKGS